MKYRYLIVASAVSLACSSAFAQQSDSQQSDPGMTQSQAQGGGASSMSPAMVKQVQQKLKQQGHDVGTVDGQWGPKTQAALKAFQKKQGMQASGELDAQTLSALGVQAGAESQAQGGQNTGGGQDAGGTSAQGSTSGAGGASAQGNGGGGTSGAGTGSSQ